MEAPCSIKRMFGDPAVTSWDVSALGQLRLDERADMVRILDTMGRLSAVAQGLRGPITSFERVKSNGQRVYLMSCAHPEKPDAVLVRTLLKVGHKKLFIRNETGDIREVEPLCVLDFYVHESCQRKGVGHIVFEAMLKDNHTTAAKLGYDKPSPKLLAFLKKHYSLHIFVAQANNFVVFNRYFESQPGKPDRRAPRNRHFPPSETSTYSGKGHITTSSLVKNVRQRGSRPADLSSSPQTIATPIPHRVPLATPVEPSLDSKENVPIADARERDPSCTLTNDHSGSAINREMPTALLQRLQLSERRGGELASGTGCGGRSESTCQMSTEGGRSADLDKAKLAGDLSSSDACNLSGGLGNEQSSGGACREATHGQRRSSLGSKVVPFVEGSKCRVEVERRRGASTVSPGKGESVAQTFGGMQLMSTPQVTYRVSMSGIGAAAALGGGRVFDEMYHKYGGALPRQRLV